MKKTIKACIGCDLDIGKHAHNGREVMMMPDIADEVIVDEIQGEGSITRMKNAPIINIPQRRLFDVCLELNKLAFPVSRHDDALFYIRPDMCIRQQDFDAIKNEMGRPFSTHYEGEKQHPKALVDELIYLPTTDDLFFMTSSIVNQLTETLTSGWFAYTNVKPGEAEVEVAFRGQGATPWFALADAWIQVQKWKLKSINDGQLRENPDDNG
jgi:hypothetical protein